MRNQNSKNKPNRRAIRTKNTLYKNLPSYKDQPIPILKVPGNGGVITTTVTTGVISVAFACDTSTVTDWANRFSSLFEEYRLVRVDAKIDTFSVLNPGLLKIFFDEKSSTVPTAAAALERSQRDIAASNTGRHVVTWRVRDIADLVYSPTGTNYTPVWLKIYTDNGNLGSSIVATPYGFVSFMYTFQFRGYST